MFKNGIKPYAVIQYVLILLVSYKYNANTNS